MVRNGGHFVKDLAKVLWFGVMGEVIERLVAISEPNGKPLQNRANALSTTDKGTDRRFFHPGLMEQ